MMGSARQFLVFALIGVINTAVHFVVFVLLLRVFGVPMLAASAIGYCAGVANSYVMNRLWTFKVTTRANSKEFLRFAAVNVVSLGINLLVLKYLTESAGLGPEVAQIGAIGASLVANFAGNKWWAFAGAREPRDQLK
ncbi:putative flippase GtrA [Povalibacter uvarum]|uniref:Putative flippase GtrA n=1 Tax=Povalibacter uvarum TaxID=732238 RepID=A0A841HFU0_9GAMM|nr:GtrA family protein [Povalibacter uvarum]MBB6091636.1 putative flippase GtrA [Povalibacter uvarum]